MEQIAWLKWLTFGICHSAPRERNLFRAYFDSVGTEMPFILALLALRFVPELNWWLCIGQVPYPDRPCVSPKAVLDKVEVQARCEVL